ncbi:hypothetical protein ACFU7T_13495 [Streptomyces sp. NPDC057555]|uniref:hypothetical protein n=1 Tax=Streptomyces sp. NPDC057555 TaxID=3346166 RepID=UPI00368BEFA5
MKQSTPQAPKAERVPALRHVDRKAGCLERPVKLPQPHAVHVTDGGGKVAAGHKLIHGGEGVAKSACGAPVAFGTKRLRRGRR